MADHVEGPLYYERMGRTGPVMAFVHPNPMDQSCWIFQMAHLSTWYRCIAIDIPGYGRSPKATAGLTMSDMAQACWEAIDDAMPGERRCSGRLLGRRRHRAIHVHHLRPQSTAALVLCGTGFRSEQGARAQAHRRPIRRAGSITAGTSRSRTSARPSAPRHSRITSRRCLPSGTCKLICRSIYQFRGRGNPRCRGPSFAYRLSGDHPDRQRGWRASARGGAEGPYSRLRDRRSSTAPGTPARSSSLGYSTATSDRISREEQSVSIEALIALVSQSRPGSVSLAPRGRP